MDDIKLFGRMSDEKILVIDDEAAIRNSFRDYLEDMEYTVFIAENGRVGMEIFKKEKIDLVVVDLRMPEFDGLDVLRAVTSVSPEIPIIVVSGTGAINDVVEALRIGAWDYLLKPVEDFSVFIHSIQKALERARLMTENRKYQNELEELVQKRTAELEEEIKIRRKAESDSKKALQEKEVLLQEVHHRVKNNMAIISAFISLKEQTQNNPEVRALFLDLQQRIRAMALVHEKLYQSNNFEEISIKAYLTELIREIADNYNTHPGGLEYNLEIDDLNFSLDILIPLGLITNEIVINSIRHAFGAVGRPRVSMELKANYNGDIIFRLADNGSGFDFHSETGRKDHMGLDIINALVMQIHGSFNCTTKYGTEYVIRFSS